MLDARSGNQTTQPNVIQSWTNDPIISPVTYQELADFLAVEATTPCGATDPLLPGLALSATAAVMKFSNVELVRRTWHWQADRFPERQAAYMGLGSMPAQSQWWVTLPAWPLISVESVTADGFEFETHSSRLFVDQPEYPLTVEYTAGYETADVPDVYKQAIMSLAAFMYEHRGDCDAEQAGRRSGAFGILAPYKRYVGGL